MKSSMNRRIGLWMDHASAKFINPGDMSASLPVLYSDTSGIIRQNGEDPTGTRLGGYRSSNNEYSKHRKEEENTREYFEAIAKRLTAYDEVLVFGPTTASQEFKNYLENLKELKNVKFHWEKSDYMTDPELCKYTREYFARRSDS